MDCFASDEILWMIATWLQPEELDATDETTKKKF
jgi:hypothetical protein